MFNYTPPNFEEQEYRENLYKQKNNKHQGMQLPRIVCRSGLALPENFSPTEGRIVEKHLSECIINIHLYSQK